MSRPKGSKNKPKTDIKILSKFVKEDGFSEANKSVDRQSIAPKALSDNEIHIRKDADGNWSGEMQKNGKTYSCRQISPEIVLQYLMFHEGEVI